MSPAGIAPSRGGEPGLSVQALKRRTCSCEVSSLASFFLDDPAAFRLWLDGGVKGRAGLVSNIYLCDIAETTSFHYFLPRP